MSKDRGDIWLAAAGLVVRDGKILVVKKSYGATKGLWTLPGGFVNADETVDMAAVREVKEETGIESEAVALLALRTGVLRKGKHDTMLVFRLRQTGGVEEPCEREIETLAWLSPEEIITSADATEFLVTLVREVQGKCGLDQQPIEFQRDYGYSVYKMFV